MALRYLKMHLHVYFFHGRSGHFSRDPTVMTETRMINYKQTPNKNKAGKCLMLHSHLNCQSGAITYKVNATTRITADQRGANGAARTEQTGRGERSELPPTQMVVLVLINADQRDQSEATRANLHIQV